MSSEEAPVLDEDSPTDYPEGLGPELRALRKAGGLTLEQLAGLADLSQPFLSQIENGRALPSLLALHRIAQSLGTSTYAILQPASRGESLVRHGSGKRFVLADGATSRWLTSGHNRHLAMTEIVSTPNTVLDHTSAHAGEEVIHIVTGSLTVFREGEDDVQLEPGDTLCYAAKVPHRWRSGPDGARFLIVCTPPSF